MSAIWQACREQAQPERLSGTLWRLVESQAQIATTRLVDTLAEQAALEEMLDGSKPAMPEAGGTHYLLRTPFRYPPLPYGSRFGARFEPSLLYGSLKVPTMLAEAAYYRFLFWHGMVTPPERPFISQHTAFTARYLTEQGLRLQGPPFDAYRDQLAHPADYAPTQALGAALREAGVEAIEFASARAPERGINVALFTPRALQSRRPLTSAPWVCQTSGERVQFLDETGRAVSSFGLEIFTVDGVLPQAAA